MNRKQRQAIAKQLSDIATRFGASVTLDDSTERGCITFNADFADVSAMSWIDDTLAPGVMIHWHSAKRDIEWLPFLESVNQFHRRKATQYGATADLACANFQAMCRAVSNGRAFREVAP